MPTQTEAILTEAAEDVRRGLWCTGEWLGGKTKGDLRDLFAEGKTSAIVSSKRPRCAAGSIIVAAAIVGASFDDAVRTIYTVEDFLNTVGGACDGCFMSHNMLLDHNDNHLPSNPHDAGESLAELFISTRDALI